MIDDDEKDVGRESVIDDAWEVSLSRLKFRARPESFFQTNTAQAEVLVDTAVEALKPLFTQDTTKQKKIVLDLFSGVGVFGLTVAHKILEHFQSHRLRNRQRSRYGCKRERHHE